MAHFSATNIGLQVIDPFSPYNSGTEVRIEAPQAHRRLAAILKGYNPWQKLRGGALLCCGS